VRTLETNGSAVKLSDWDGGRRPRARAARPTGRFPDS
jgi:hypothetical protein